MRFHLIALFIFLLSPLISPAQDSLRASDLLPHTVYFQVEDGEMNAEGKQYWEEMVRENGVVLLGEYHGSRNISQFTQALLPVMGEMGCRHFALEVGPTSAEILTERSQKPEETVQELRSLNTRYLYGDSSRYYTPIPFFSHVSDAEFLAEASQLKMQLIGMDQEFKFGYKLIAWELWGRMKKANRKRILFDFTDVLDSLDTAYAREMQYYATRDKSLPRFSAAIPEMRVWDSYLNYAARQSDWHAGVVEDLRTTMEIYRTNQVRAYWQSNALRTEEWKRNLREGLERTEFDWKTDPLLIKVGGVHVAKGPNSYRFYDLGNMVAELCAYHGRQSLHVNFLSRFYMDGDSLVDELADPTSWYAKTRGALIQVGRPDAWTAVDIRGIRDDVYYQNAYLLHPEMKKFFLKYDLVVIPPTEVEAVPNVDFSRG